MRRSILLLTILFIELFSPETHAAIAPEDIPEPLRPWVQWVLQGHETERCPFFQGRESERNCAWQSPLELTLETKGGTFRQGWTVQAKTYLGLPGDVDHWPQQVMVNGQGAAVVLHDETPSIFLLPGSYMVTGSFQWDKLPDAFPIPDETGIVQLTLNGTRVDFPRRDDSGSIWLGRETGEGAAEDRLEIRAHRKMVDDIPFVLTTKISLDVSGKPREILLNGALLPGFIPLSLTSSLPARIESDGKLRVQLKAGTWEIEVEGRFQGPVQALEFPQFSEPWPTDEVWVFEARNDLRLVVIVGVPAVDPQQTTLPDDWKSLPAYRIQPGAKIRFEEKRRGDSDPAPDQLNLQREWWLDFNGSGFTVQDQISGTLNRSWRLEMNPPVQLGRVTVTGKDQFITRLPGDPRSGIEIRQGRVSLISESRLDQRKLAVPAVGWNQDFQQVSGALNLPPGWRLFAVSGADHVPDTWVNQWTLLQLFLVLITALAFWKLWGMKWGIVTLFTLALIFPEENAPQWIWLIVLAGFALLRVLHSGKIHSLLKLYKWVSLIVLLVFSIPFMIQQIRVGMYPALEHPYVSMPGPVPVTAQAKAEGMAQPVPMAPAPAKQMRAADEEMEAAPPPPEEGMVQRENLPISSLGKTKIFYTQKSQLNLQEQRPGAKIQTGPGLPRWSWNRVSLEWSGPVEKSQTLRLFLLPPWVNLILAFVRVGLLVALLLCLLGISGSILRKFFKRRLPANTGHSTMAGLPANVDKDSKMAGLPANVDKDSKMAGLVLVLLFFLGTGVGLGAFPTRAHADFPSPDLLNELRTQLLEAPECFPLCASISRMELEISPNQFRARLELNAQAEVAVPLPGSAKEWIPQTLLVDGQAYSGLLRYGEEQLWIQVGPGVHQVLLEGPLPDQETVQIALPLKPYFAAAQVEGWTLAGIHEDGQVDDNIQLTRLPAMAGLQRSAETLPAGAMTGGNGALPPFVLVNRQLVLGLTWEVITRVVRVTPAGTPVVLEVPLLEGESVTTPGMRVEQGKVKVNLSPTATELEWRSVLAETKQINLKANEVATNWMEIWQLNVSPVWHVTLKGIPRIHSSNPEGMIMPEWRPWPGESVTIEVGRPEGVEGPTLTIDQSTMDLTPGLRFTEFSLRLNLRSSLGGQHTLTLPPDAQLQTVTINGNLQPIRSDKGKVILPITPGSQEIELKWQQPAGIKNFFRAPGVDLGLNSVNAEIQIHMSNNRWILFAGGPRMGPAVLFWSLLMVLLLFSFGLSRLGWTPLGLFSWILLGLGISQFPELPVVASVFVAGWLLALGWRKNMVEVGKFWFDLRQIVLVFYTLGALIVLFVSIHQGLLGLPDMQISGNGSDALVLRWFQDRSSSTLPRPWGISVPIFYYRLAMLAWALWIAWALLKWLKWGWNCLSEGGLWRPLGILKKK
jgi:hypothetical protein